MRTIRLSLYIVSILSLYHPLPSFPPALVTYASYPISLLRIITPSFFPRLFRSHALPIPFAHSGNTLSRRIRYSRFLRTFNARESLRRSGARLFVRAFVQTDDVGGKTTSPVRREVASVRVHPRRASQNQNPARPEWTARRETPSFSRHAAVVELGKGDPRRIETQARGGSVSQSRCRRFR